MHVRLWDSRGLVHGLGGSGLPLPRPPRPPAAGPARGGPAGPGEGTGRPPTCLSFPSEPRATPFKTVLASSLRDLLCGGNVPGRQRSLWMPPVPSVSGPSLSQGVVACVPSAYFIPGLEGPSRQCHRFVWGSRSSAGVTVCRHPDRQPLRRVAVGFYSVTLLCGGQLTGRRTFLPPQGGARFSRQGRCRRTRAGAPDLCTHTHPRATQSTVPGRESRDPAVHPGALVQRGPDGNNVASVQSELGRR